MEELGIDFNNSGSVMSKGQLEELRKKRGECVTCGRKCFQKRLFKMIPITDHGRVMNGRCLNCNPVSQEESGSGALPAAARPATREDLTRFQKSQSSANLTGQRNARSFGRTKSDLSQARHMRSARTVSHSSDGASPSQAGRDSSVGRTPSNKPAALGSDGSAHCGREFSSMARSQSVKGTGGFGFDPTSRGGANRTGPARSASTRMLNLDGSNRGVSRNTADGSNRISRPGLDNRGLSRTSLDGGSSRGASRGVKARHTAMARGMSSRELQRGDFSRSSSSRSLTQQRRPSFETARERERERERDRHRETNREYGIDHSSNHSSHSANHSSHSANHSSHSANHSSHSANHSSHSATRSVASIQGSSADSAGRARQPEELRDALQRMTEMYGEELPPKDHPDTATLMEVYRKTIDMSQSSLSGDRGSAHQGSVRHPDDLLDIPRHGVLNRGGAVVFPDGSTGSTSNSTRFESSQRTMNSISSREDDGQNGSLRNSARRLVPPINVTFSHQQHEDEEYALERIDAAHGDPIKVVSVLAEFHNSQLVHKVALKELSLIRLDQYSQERLAKNGAMSLITNAMEASPHDLDVQVHGCRAMWNVSGTHENQVAFAKVGAIDTVLAAMDVFPDSVEMHECALSTLSHLGAAEENLPELIEKGAIRRIVDSMTKHVENALLQGKGCMAIASMASHPSPLNRDIMDMGGGGVIFVCMSMHPDDFDLQEKAMQALKNLSANNDQNRMEIAGIGGIEAVIAAMQLHRNDILIQEVGAWTLSNLAVVNENKMLIGEGGGIDVVIRAMWVHHTTVSVIEWCCRALYMLTFDRHNSAICIDVGAISCIVNSMQSHVDSRMVQEMGCAVLRNLAFDDGSKLRIVDEEALDAIVLAMVLFSEEPMVQERACEVLLQLAVGPNVKSMQASNIYPLIMTAIDKFPSCERVGSQLAHVLGS